MQSTGIRNAERCFQRYMRRISGMLNMNRIHAVPLDNPSLWRVPVPRVLPRYPGLTGLPVITVISRSNSCASRGISSENAQKTLKNRHTPEISGKMRQIRGSPAAAGALTDRQNPVYAGEKGLIGEGHVRLRQGGCVECQVMARLSSMACLTAPSSALTLSNGPLLCLMAVSGSFRP